MQCVTFYCIWHFLWVNPDDPWLCSGCISDNVCSSVCHVLDWWTYTLVYPQHLSGFMDVINWWGAVSVWRKGVIIFYVLNDLCLLIFFLPRSCTQKITIGNTNSVTWFRIWWRLCPLVRPRRLDWSTPGAVPSCP